jgi:hypothetical protein
VQERVVLSVSERSIAMQAGAQPVSVQVTLTNRSQVVDQYDLQVEGGEPDWYDISPDRVSLFPGESATARLTLHPPRRESVIAATYPLTVRASSRDVAAAAGSAALQLTIRPSGGFQLQLLRARVTGRSGSFGLHVANLSDAPLVLSLSAHDPEAALTFYFPDLDLELRPYEERDFVFSVRPNRRPLKGEPVAYPFTVEATPRYPDVARAAAEAQRVSGEFVFQPRLRHWPWEGVPKLVALLMPLAAVGAAVMAVLVASGAVGGRAADPPPPDIAATLAARDQSASATAQAAAANATQSVTPTPTATATLTATPTLTATATATATSRPTQTATATRTPAPGTPRPPIGPTLVGPILQPRSP